MKKIFLISSIQIITICTLCAQLSVSIPNLNITPGTIISLPVSVSTSIPRDIGAFQFTILWDETVLTFIDIDEYSIHIPDFSISDFGTPADHGDNGKLIATWADYPQFFNVNDNQILFTIQFQVNEGTTEIIFDPESTKEFYDEDYFPMGTGFEPGSIDATGCPVDLYLPGNLYSAENRASNNVSSNGKISNNAAVSFIGGNRIDLLPGFETKFNTEFLATVVEFPCDVTIPVARASATKDKIITKKEEPVKE